MRYAMRGAMFTYALPRHVALLRYCHMLLCAIVAMYKRYAAADAAQLLLMLCRYADTCERCRCYMRY